MNATESHYPTIFWPTSIAQSGILFGWQHAYGHIVIAGVIPLDRSEIPLKTRFKTVQAAVNQAGVIDAEELAILGFCKSSDASAIPIDMTSMQDSDTSEELRIEIRDCLPHVESPCRIILFDPPSGRKLRYLSETPIALATSCYALRSDNHPANSGQQNGVNGLFSNKQPRAIDTTKVIMQANAVHGIQTCLKEGNRENNIAEVGIIDTLFTSSFIRKVFTIAGTFLLASIHMLNYPFFGSNSLKDISATAHQLDVRLRQGLASPSQLALSRSKADVDISVSSSRYISFYNMLWLVVNDAIIGSAVRSFLCENAQQVSGMLAHASKQWSIRYLQETLLWLNNWPAGLKLNLEVGSFFCDAFLWFTSIWEEVVMDSVLLPNLPSIIYMLGISATVGTTMSLAIASDILSLATFHLYIFYSMSTAVFAFHISALNSLFNIFRGRKFNIIRQRIEPSEYTLDQLLIGAILFTLAAFLFPTVLVFYLAFAASRCCIVAIHAMMEAILAFLNHFPLFAIMLRFKDPKRLPGGLAFEPVSRANRSYLQLKNIPVSIRMIFHEYWALWSSFSQHYSPFLVLGKVFQGRYINPIPRSRLTFNPELGR